MLKIHYQNIHLYTIDMLSITAALFLATSNFSEDFFRERIDLARRRREYR